MIGKYNMIEDEKRLNDVISQFDAEYAMDVITCVINEVPGVSSGIKGKPNLIYVIEMKMKVAIEQLQEEDNVTEINILRQKRIDLYTDIISFICNTFDISYDLTNTSESDLYYIAFYIYDLFINYYKYMCRFFVNYILKYKNDIYETYNLAQYKKSKDSSTVYNKKVYKNQKIAIIISNLELVINNICNEPISFSQYLALANTDPTINNYVLSIIQPRDDYFSNTINKILSNIDSQQLLLSDVRIELANSSDEMLTDLGISDYIE